jgi:hypothetical protein
VTEREPSALPRQLSRVFRRLAAVGLLTAAGWAVVVAAAVVTVAVGVDVLLELSAAGRVVALVAAGVSLIGLVVAGIAWVRRRSSEDQLAQEIDRAGNTGGRIRVGIDLLRNRPPAGTVAASFAALAVAEAAALAKSVPASHVAPARPLAWPVLGAMGLGIIVVLVHLIYPGLLAAQWDRFADPFGDHPPYSRVRYAVEPGDTRVQYGGALEIVVRPDGPPQTRLNLVVEPAEGPAETVPMFAQPDGEWRSTLTNVTAPFRYHVRSAAGRSPRFTVDVVTVPTLENVRVRITPVAYTGRPAYEGPVPPAGVAGLLGTRVTLWATSNRPLSGGRLMLTPTPAEPVLVTPVAAEANEVTATFEVRAAGQVRLKVTDVEGQESADTFAAAVTLLTDEPPFVRLIDLRELSLATPTAALPVGIAAEDDYGLARVRLYRSLNGSRPQPVDLPLPPTPALRANEIVRLPLAQFGLAPGDELRLFARAGDTDPAGSKAVETPAAVVRIVSQEQFEQMLKVRHGLEMLMSKYRAAQRRMESAKAGVDELRKKRKDRKGAAEDRDRAELRELVEQLRKDAQAARNAAKPLDLDLDQALNGRLATLSRDLDALAKALEEVAGKEGLTADEIEQALRDAAGSLDREMADFQKDVLDPLEFLRSVVPLLEAERRFEKLVARQKDLARRLEPVKDRERVTAPAQRNGMKGMQADQERIRVELAQLLDEIEGRAALLPDTPELAELKESAREFVETVRQSGAADAMTDAEAGLGQMSGKRGYDGAKKAADILEGLLKKEQGESGMGGRGRRALRFCPGLGQRLGKTLEQLLGAGQGEGDGQSGFGTGSERSQEVGLYGSLPGLGDVGTEELTSRPGARGAADPRDPAAAKTGPTGTGDGRGAAPTAGANREATVPASYRRRVAEYFQRVADETGK